MTILSNDKRWKSFVENWPMFVSWMNEQYDSLTNKRFGILLMKINKSLTITHGELNGTTNMKGKGGKKKRATEIEATWILLFCMWIVFIDVNFLLNTFAYEGSEMLPHIKWSGGHKRKTKTVEKKSEKGHTMVMRRQDLFFFVKLRCESSGIQCHSVKCGDWCKTIEG